MNVKGDVKLTVRKTFVISDTHFSHANILKFTDGKKPLRPFNSMEEMNEYMISKWNEVVGENDVVFHIGDVVFAQTGFECLGRLNGDKRLIMGNHERHKMEKYQEYFTDIRAYAEKNDFLLSHIPVHPSQMGRWKGNIHGHLHSGYVTMIDRNGDGIADPRYFCVSVERINYTPILLDEIFTIFKEMGIG